MSSKSTEICYSIMCNSMCPIEENIKPLTTLISFKHTDPLVQLGNIIFFSYVHTNEKMRTI